MATAKVNSELFNLWLAEHCVRDANASTLTRALYADFQTFARGVGMKDQAFAKAMERAGFRSIKLADGLRRQGIRLKVAFMAPPVAQPDQAGALEALSDPGFKRAVRTVTASLRTVPATYGATDTPRGTPSRTSPPGEEDVVDIAIALPRPLVNEWFSVPFAGGEDGVRSIGLQCPDEGDAIPARIAGELYVEARRVRQPIGEGGEDFTTADDDALPAGELARMAAAYAFAGSVPPKWASWLTLSGKPPRDHEGAPVIAILRMLWLRGSELWKPAGQRRMLVKAGALIVHAIARIDRDAARQQGEWA